MPNEWILQFCGYFSIGLWLCHAEKLNKTPNLDRIAKEGMRFDRCFVTNSICGPSRAVVQEMKTKLAELRRQYQDDGSVVPFDIKTEKRKRSGKKGKRRPRKAGG